MCHRVLRFVKHTGCGHNSFQGDSVIDCRSRDCTISSHHPSPCNRCTCRRYYGQPHRLITNEVPDKCPLCKRS
ncbi:hypothetical protein EV401DRAFT_2271863 [Pisolithus croceorrhizus]|nr:hypothetical protein EV401DRAFT_2271863 [Pisolithus croceorrhizus]